MPPKLSSAFVVLSGSPRALLSRRGAVYTVSVLVRDARNEITAWHFRSPLDRVETKAYSGRVARIQEALRGPHARRRLTECFPITHASIWHCTNDTFDGSAKTSGLAFHAGNALLQLSGMDTMPVD